MNFKIDWNLPSIEKVKALLIVAHPDDETIFCGGTMITYPEWEWTVISMTNYDRSYEFKEAIESFKRLGVNIISYKILGQKDIPQNRKATKEERLAWIETIKAQNFSPDITFTHNEMGEYGHSAHILLNELVYELSLNNVWEFIYPKSSQSYKKNVNEVHLNKKILEEKRLTFCYYKSQSYIWKIFKDLMLYEFKTGPEIFTSD